LLAGTATDKLPYPDFKRALAEAATLVGVELAAIDEQELQHLEQAHNRQSALSYAQRLAERELLRKNDKASMSRQYLTGRGLLTAHIKDLGLGLVTARTCKAVAEKYGSKLFNDLGLNNLTGYVTSVGLDLHGNPLALHGRLPTHADNNRRDKMSTRGSGIKSVPFRLFEAVQKGKKQVVLVEGLFDALLCHAYGEPRAIAVMRNSLSKAQALALEQAGVSAAAICFDQDDAGKEHVLTTISQLSARGIRAFVVPSLAGSEQ
jgi:DNA primase